MDQNLIGDASIEDLARGYKEQEEGYECLFCGEYTEKGMIYPDGNEFFDAQRFMIRHLEKTHGSVFEQLITLDKKLTGLSEHQCKLLKLFFSGKSDSEIQEELHIGSGSTIRNHRFAFKEKERQARIFIAIMELMRAHEKQLLKPVRPHKTATMVDDRYKTVEKEAREILKNLFPEELEGRLKNWPSKEKSKLVVLKEIIKRFHPGRTYTEKQVNEIIKTIHDDFATIRRYLIAYGFMDRKNDGSAYWVKQEGEQTVTRRDELKQQFKEIKIQAGVYQIKNTVNGKVLIVSTPDLKSINGRKMELQSGKHYIPRVQKELDQYGSDAFTVEILEVLEQKEDGYFNAADELKKLKQKWIDKLQPFGDKGYHTKE